MAKGPAVFKQEERAQMKFELDFRPASETPTEPGDYIIYNQCDGYHIVEAWFEGGIFLSFAVFAGEIVSKSFYRAWAKLPESHTTMYAAFAKKDG
jgi:hypothetical protein